MAIRIGMKGLPTACMSYLAVGALVSGCGRDLKLSVKASESEKDKPTAALVRKIEVSYHDSGGHEQMRESLAVLGLSQPVMARSDLLRGVDARPDGTFEARAYTADGLLLLSGSSKPSETSDTVEITMDREASHSTALASPMLRRLRLVDAPGVGEYSQEVREAASNGGSWGSPEETGFQRCMAFPLVRISSAAGRFPRLILEGAVKAPEFMVEAWVVKDGKAKKLGDWAHVPVNFNGDAEIELGRTFLAGALLAGPVHLGLKIRSHRYEACLRLEAKPEAVGVLSSLVFERGLGKKFYIPALEPVARFDFFNPNDFPVRVVLSAAATAQDARGVLRACFHASNDAISLEKLECAHGSPKALSLAGRSSGGFALFGVLDSNGQYQNRELRLSWAVVTEMIGESGAKETVASESGTWFIP